MRSDQSARSDENLLAAARQGDRRALDEIIARYQPRVFRFGLKMCGPEDAEDILQETLIAAVRNLRHYRQEGSFTTWLYAIARHACLKRRRRSKFAPAREESIDALPRGDVERVADSGRSPEERAAARQLSQALDRALQAIGPRDREVLVLRDIEGLTAEETSKVLGLSVAAVKSRLHRARAAVRARLAPLLAPVPQGSADCPDVTALFSRFLEGDLPPSACAEMEAHLARCGHCHGLCESLRQTLALCRGVPAAPVPAGVAESVRSAVRAFLSGHSSHRLA